MSQGQDGDLVGIYQQRYHANGDAFGNETRVNTPYHGQSVGAIDHGPVRWRLARDVAV